jgi:hypothetical protein
MPKVGSLSFRVDTEYPVKYDIYYSQSKQFEIRGLSSDFVGSTGVQTCYYPTESILNDTIYKAIMKYRELKTKSRLVIAYSFHASTELRMNKVGAGSYVGNLPGVSRKIKEFQVHGGNCPFAIGLFYSIYMEVDDGKKLYYKVNNNLEMNKNSEVSVYDCTIIEYSPERLGFFQGIVESLKSAVVATSRFADLEGEEAQDLIDSGQMTKLLG